MEEEGVKKRKEGEKRKKKNGKDCQWERKREAHGVPGPPRAWPPSLLLLSFLLIPLSSSSASPLRLSSILAMLAL